MGHIETIVTELNTETYKLVANEYFYSQAFINNHREA